MKKKIRKKRGFGLLEVIKDLRNYSKWASVIKAEAQNPNSKFNTYGLNHNYFYVLYIPVTLPQEDLALPDNIKRFRNVNSHSPVLG